MTSLFYPALALHVQRKSIHNATTAAAAAAAAGSRASYSHSHSHSHRHPQQQQQQRTLTGPLSLFSTPLLDSFFPFPEPVLPVPPAFFPVWNNEDEDEDDGDEEEERPEYFTLELQDQYLGNTSSTTATTSCDLLVAPVAWTTMKQVFTWRSSRLGGRRLVMPESSVEGSTEESSSRAFRDKLEHVVDNWEAVTAGEMTSVRLPSRISTIAADATEGNEIYTFSQPIFRASQETDFHVQPDRFIGPWSAALEAIKEQARAEEYVYTGWGTGGDVITYKVSVSPCCP